MNSFEHIHAFKNYQYETIEPKKREKPILVFNDIKDLFQHLHNFDLMTLSFHHHLRNGDMVINQVLSKYLDEKIQLNLAISSIFPNYTMINTMIKEGLVNNIHTNYLNGPVSKSINQQLLNGYLYLHSHGGRSRAISCGEIEIDIAFIAASECDKNGNANGMYGPSAFGSIGYAVEDARFAKTTVVVTDNLVDETSFKHIDGQYVDYILVVDSIGDPTGIVSGTTKITKDPIGLVIADKTTTLITKSPYYKNGLSFQTGAGGTSLAVADMLKLSMQKDGIVGSFASGGITGPIVEMFENGLFKKLYDVQCFDLQAIESIRKNREHIFMSASKYANLLDDCIVNDLDVVILGATEIDLDFNVNVISDANGKIIGGSGGHCDTAYGAKLTIITSPLFKGRIPLIKDRVTTITTPGESVDILVTERGICINPLRIDLIEYFDNYGLKHVTIDKLQELSYKLCGIPDPIEHSSDIIGYVVYRDGTILDTLYHYE